MKQPPRTWIVGIAWMLASSATAASISSGTITGFFDDPVLTGSFLQVGTRLPVARDNTSTVARSGLGTSSIAWSDASGGAVPPSTLTFTGNAFSDVEPNQVFPLGTLTYFNGLNGATALIFGVTMHLSAGGGIAPVTAPVAIVSTQNGSGDRVADADFLFFGTFGVPSTLAAFEDMAVSAVVYGRLTDDAQLEVTSISLAEDEADHGCVGEGPLEDSKGPCASGCGHVCAAIALALSGPLCGSERMPAVLNRRIGRALDLLGQGRDADSGKNAKRRVARVMKQLRKSATTAYGAAERGRISAACADAVAKALGNAQRQAEPWLSGR